MKSAASFERPPMTAEQLEHHTQFLTATRGADAWTIAQVLSRMTPGRDWRKCSRALMARYYADVKAPRFGDNPRDSSLKAVELPALRLALDKALRLKGRELPPQPAPKVT